MISNLTMANITNDTIRTLLEVARISYLNSLGNISNLNVLNITNDDIQTFMGGISISSLNSLGNLSDLIAENFVNETLSIFLSTNDAIRNISNSNSTILRAMVVSNETFARLQSTAEVIVPAAATAVIGYFAVSGVFVLIGLSPTGPIAGGLFASNMGAAVKAGSLMSFLQSAAMGGSLYHNAVATLGAAASAAYNLFRRQKLSANGKTCF